MASEAAPVLGVDGCPAGWVGVALGPDETSVHVAAEIADVAAAVGDVAVIGVDIPIGLPDAGRRRADVLARRAAGPRWRSVFLTPVRPALRAADHASAVRLNRRLTGEGVSIQAYGLRKRIFEVESWARACADRVVEVHPEVSFASLAGEPLRSSKTTPAGLDRRRDLLARAGIFLGTPPRGARLDDLLDAAVAAWSARRVVSGEAVCLPDPPEVFSDGWSCAIWA